MYNCPFVYLWSVHNVVDKEQYSVPFTSCKFFFFIYFFFPTKDNRKKDYYGSVCMLFYSPLIDPSILPYTLIRLTTLHWNTMPRDIKRKEWLDGIVRLICIISSPKLDKKTSIGCLSVHYLAGIWRLTGDMRASQLLSLSRP